jgi:hypothetical protein
MATTSSEKVCTGGSDLHRNGADPSARNLDGENSVDIARQRFERLQAFFTSPMPDWIYAWKTEALSRERTSSRAIMQYLAPEYVQPDIPAIHRNVRCDGCDKVRCTRLSCRVRANSRSFLIASLVFVTNARYAKTLTFAQTATEMLQRIILGTNSLRIQSRY